MLNVIYFVDVNCSLLIKVIVSIAGIDRIYRYFQVSKFGELCSIFFRFIGHFSLYTEHDVNNDCFIHINYIVTVLLIDFKKIRFVFDDLK